MSPSTAVKIKIRNWSEYQHYNDRNPPWIKLHSKLMNNRLFMALPAESVRLLVLLWIVASRSKDGSIEAETPEDLAFVLRMDSFPAGDLRVLVKAKFIDVSGDLLADVGNLAQKCVSERETEAEREREAIKQTRNAPPEVDVVTAWMERDGRTLPQIAEAITAFVTGAGLSFTDGVPKWCQANGAPPEAEAMFRTAIERMPHADGVPDDFGPPGEREQLLSIGDPLVEAISSRDGITESQVVAKASDYKGRRGKTYTALRQIPANRHTRLVHTVNTLREMAGVNTRASPRRDLSVDAIQDWAIESMEAEGAVDRSGDVRARIRATSEGPRHLRDQGANPNLLGGSVSAQPGPVGARGTGGERRPGPPVTGAVVAAGEVVGVGAELLGPDRKSATGADGAGHGGLKVPAPTGGNGPGVREAVRGIPARGGGDSDDAGGEDAVQGQRG